MTKLLFEGKPKANTILFAADFTGDDGRRPHNKVLTIFSFWGMNIAHTCEALYTLQLSLYYFIGTLQLVLVYKNI
jgi:hypothetical protein